MKKEYLILAIFLAVSSQFAIAQNRAVVQVELIDEDDQGKSRGSGSAFESFSVKLNPLLFFRGNIPIYVEANLSEKAAVEVGVGFTHKDYLDINSSWFGGYNLNIDEDITIEKSNITNDIGMSFHLGLRYYASGSSWQSEGPYFGIDYRFQQYNAILNGYTTYWNGDYATISDLDDKLSRVNHDFKLSFGYLYYFEDNAFIEPYVGMGIRARTIDQFGEVTTGNVSSIAFFEEKEKVPFLSLGIKIGISLSN